MDVCACGRELLSRLRRLVGRGRAVFQSPRHGRVKGDRLPHPSGLETGAAPIEHARLLVQVQEAGGASGGATHDLARSVHLQAKKACPLRLVPAGTSRIVRMGHRRREEAKLSTVGQAYHVPCRGSGRGGWRENVSPDGHEQNDCRRKYHPFGLRGATSISHPGAFDPGRPFRPAVDPRAIPPGRSGAAMKARRGWTQSGKC